MTCKDCICCEVCYYKSFNDVRALQKRRNDVEKICKSFVHRDRLKNAPTVDAVEVVHGYNLDEDTPSLFECSICHWSCSDTYYGDTADYNYCPNCGAKMRGDDE